MAFTKTANAVVTDIISLKAWEKMHPRGTFRHQASSINKVITESSKYLLSHCTIMASVAVEEAPYDFRILPESAHLVNNNDDAWTTDVLRLSYKTFIGAFNFLEHLQKRKAAKGHILDAIFRYVKLTPDIKVAYIDILVATDLAHEKLVSDIRDKKVRYMSMGCTTDLVVCSYCGARCTTSGSFCQHLLAMKGQFLLDEDGIPRRIAELCGHKSLPFGGVKFVEASWVGTPAFPGAASRAIILDGWVGPKTPFTRAATATKTGSSRLILTPDEAKLDAHLRKIF